MDRNEAGVLQLLRQVKQMKRGLELDTGAGARRTEKAVKPECKPKVVFRSPITTRVSSNRKSGQPAKRLFPQCGREGDSSESVVNTSPAKLLERPSMVPDSPSVEQLSDLCASVTAAHLNRRVSPNKDQGSPLEPVKDVSQGTCEVNATSHGLEDTHGPSPVDAVTVAEEMKALLESRDVDISRLEKQLSELSVALDGRDLYIQQLSSKLSEADRVRDQLQWRLEIASGSEAEIVALYRELDSIKHKLSQSCDEAANMERERDAAFEERDRAKGLLDRCISIMAHCPECQRRERSTTDQSKDEMRSSLDSVARSSFDSEAPRISSSSKSRARRALRKGIEEGLRLSMGSEMSYSPQDEDEDVVLLDSFMEFFAARMSGDRTSQNSRYANVNKGFSTEEAEDDVFQARSQNLVVLRHFTKRWKKKIVTRGYSRTVFKNTRLSTLAVQASEFLHHWMFCVNSRQVIRKQKECAEAHYKKSVITFWLARAKSFGRMRRLKASFTYRVTKNYMDRSFKCFCDGVANASRLRQSPAFRATRLFMKHVVVHWQHVAERRKRLAHATENLAAICTMTAKRGAFRAWSECRQEESEVQTRFEGINIYKPDFSKAATRPSGEVSAMPLDEPSKSARPVKKSSQSPWSCPSINLLDHQIDSTGDEALKCNSCLDSSVSDIDSGEHPYRESHEMPVKTTDVGGDIADDVPESKAVADTFESDVLTSIENTNVPASPEQKKDTNGALMVGTLTNKHPQSPLQVLLHRHSSKEQDPRVPSGLRRLHAFLQEPNKHVPKGAPFRRASEGKMRTTNNENTVAGHSPGTKLQLYVDKGRAIEKRLGDLQKKIKEKEGRVSALVHSKNEEATH